MAKILEFPKWKRKEPERRFTEHNIEAAYAHLGDRLDPEVWIASMPWDDIQ